MKDLTVDVKGTVKPTPSVASCQKHTMLVNNAPVYVLLDVSQGGSCEAGK